MKKVKWFYSFVVANEVLFVGSDCNVIEVDNQEKPEEVLAMIKSILLKKHGDNFTVLAFNKV